MPLPEVPAKIRLAKEGACPEDSDTNARDRCRGLG
jgi:hypothetical protein